jgi:hypothetical protein
MLLSRNNESFVVIRGNQSGGDKAVNGTDEPTQPFHKTKINK